MFCSIQISFLYFQLINKRPCVLGHAKAQRAVRYYNYLAGLCVHYEITYHKAWFDYAEEVRQYINLPVLIIQRYAAIYKVNFRNEIYQLIRETEGMWKLGLNVPNIASVVAYCKERILNPYLVLKDTCKEYDKFREAIAPVFLSIMRFRLKDMQTELNPGLCNVTWISENLEDYAKSIESKIFEIVAFYKRVTDIEKIQIQGEMDSILDTIYAYLPETPETSEDFLDNSTAKRQQMQDIIEKKSICIERAVIDLINMFVELLEFGERDSKGRRNYQLPPDQITEENWKTETFLPINKWDWIRFEKIYRTVYLPSNDICEQMRSKNYEGTKYELYHLHYDAMDLFSFYNMKMINTLVYCSKKSLDLIKNRVLQ